jgi:hypothetical protein
MAEGSEPDELDKIDHTVLRAREHADEALDVLIACLHSENAMYVDKLKAAQHILEVAGCLSL